MDKKLVLAALAVVIPGTVLAEQVAEPLSGAATELETITAVGTRTERAISDVAATVSVISEEDIDREIVRDIADLVRYEPGVSVAGTGDRFGLGGFSIRGIGGNRVLTLVDGIRVPDEFSFGPYLSARRDFVDIESLQRAEIARGPISSLYGSDALGGVVAFTTRKPSDYLEPDDGSYGSVKGGWSGADESVVGALTLAGGNERFAGMLFYTASSGHETENAGIVGGTGPGRELPDPQDIDTDNLVGKLSWSPADGHEFVVAVDNYTNETATDILSDYGTLTSGTTTDRRDANDERDRTRYSLSYDFAGDTLLVDDVTATVYQQESESVQKMNEDRTTASGEAQTRVRDSEFKQAIDGAFVQFGKAIDTASSNHYLIWGVDYYRTDSESVRDGGTFAADGSPVFDSPLPTRDFPLTEVEQLGVFLQDEVSLLDGRLLLSPGLRYDSFEADAEADTIYEHGNPGQPEPEDYDDSEVTARLGAVWHLDDAWSVYGRYSEGFRAPPYDDVNVGFTNFIGGYKTISNPDLESERSAGFESGVRFGSGGTALQLAVYTNEYENFIESFAVAPEFLPTGGIDPADGLLTFQSINREAVEINGAELSGTFDLASLSDWTDGLSMRFAIAYADGEDEETGAPIDSVEPLTGIVGLRYATPSGRWGGELVLTAVDAKDEGDIGAGSLRMPTAGYGVLDLLGHYSFSDAMHLYGGLFNLTDRTYIRWADTTGIGSDAAARFTQPGFNAGVTLRVEF